MPQTFYVEEIFNHLHAIPELGFNEIQTSRFISDELKQFGYTVTDKVGGTGVLGGIDTGVPGPVLAVRADMDALEFEVEGKKVNIHACGHDANSSMALATAKQISEDGFNRGKLVFIFQPAEERLTGALAMIKSGLLKEITEIVGIHLRPHQELALGNATPMLIHGAAVVMNVNIKGLSSHGAWPHEGINAAEAAVMVVNAVSAVKADPRVPHSAKITQINTMGSAFNIIPDEVELKIDIRSQSNSVMSEMLDKIKNAIRYAAKSIGADAEISIPINVVAADYHPDMVCAAEEAIQETLGKVADKIVTPGTEDFHFFTSKLKAKTVYIGLGGDVKPVLHHPEMSFDLKALRHGQEILSRIIHKRLG